ncbi:hypothetical protein, partial [Rhodoblastus sp.]|uniref:hypothetical protein n=1 Tax=Rhodoblastus sp. TaxID=1962975 RepID=UPI0035B23304
MAADSPNHAPEPLFEIDLVQFLAARNRTRESHPHLRVSLFRGRYFFQQKNSGCAPALPELLTAEPLCQMARALICWAIYSAWRIASETIVKV